MRTPYAAAFIVISLASAAAAQDAVTEFNRSARAPCVPSYPCFVVSNAYPTTLPVETNQPWAGIDYKLEPARYLNAVLKYVVEGNPEIDWEIARNKVRKWYHAPWMHAVREPIHGLTSERGSRWRELSGAQIRRADNWAVGFYNPIGGYTLGQVWTDKAKPNPEVARFPVGTVTAKLLLTDATDQEAPFIAHESNLAWFADTLNTGMPKRYRLLQVDVAVKHAESAAFSGWVFGTFVFDGSQGKAHYWENLVPVGLEWGTSPSHTYSQFRSGAKPAEGWVNDTVVAKLQRAPEGSMGYLGRMNGPVDNPLSSCLSCHSRALASQDNTAPPFTPPEAALCIERVRLDNNETYRRVSNCTVNEPVIAKWYRNLKSNEPFEPNTTSLDYSLQLALGIANWKTWTAAHATPSVPAQVTSLQSVGTSAATSKLPAIRGFRRDGP